MLQVKKKKEIQMSYTQKFDIENSFYLRHVKRLS